MVDKAGCGQTQLQGPGISHSSPHTSQGRSCPIRHVPSALGGSLDSHHTYNFLLKWQNCAEVGQSPFSVPEDAHLKNTESSEPNRSAWGEKHRMWGVSYVFYIYVKAEE